MPRYLYRCSVCTQEMTLFHLAEETVAQCPKCDAEDTLTKLLTPITTLSTPSIDSPQKVGSVTEEFIRKSRQELARQKDQLRNKKK